jgi:integrative and conjugative element protein (TIGR02256 family)
VLERVVLLPAARASLVGHTRSAPESETGGILIGRKIDDQTVCVTRASPPGPRALHRRTRFSRDTRFLQHYLDDVHERTDGSEDYIGEWHVHPALDAPPSPIDCRSLFRIARRRNYATDNPILIIVESGADLQQLRAYGFAVKPTKWWDELPLVDS